VVDRDFWRGRRVFLTGHTGFKGGWLATWLLDMGAEVAGYALTPESEPSFFRLCGLDGRMRSTFGDIRDHAELARALQSATPEIVFHLAAQPLVRRSYREPVDTLAANVLGTAHLLEAARGSPSARAVVVVTSDKCYEDTGASAAYVEDDPLGGHDPYSASKACAELVTAAYSDRGGPAVATARAGNVIGGGDWAEDRLVPDAVRALSRGAPLVVRNPGAKRPWQHVLEPLAGYLILAERLHEGRAAWAEAWNFGPGADGAATVAELADLLVACWGQGSWRTAPTDLGAPSESAWLALNSDKARRRLGWRPVFSLPDAVAMTVAWYRGAQAVAPGRAVFELSREQINAWTSRAQPAPIR